MRLLKAAASREELRLQRERGETLNRLDASQAISTAVSTFWYSIERLFECELPPILAGLTALEIRQQLGEAAKRLKAQIKSDLEKLANEK